VRNQQMCADMDSRDEAEAPKFRHWRGSRAAKSCRTFRVGDGFAGTSAFGPPLAPFRGVTALLAVPELPPLPEAPPETSLDASPEEISFASIFAAIEVSRENESSDEEINETASVAVAPAADSLALRLGWFELAAHEEPPALSRAPEGATREPSRSDAGTSPIAAPVVFELEVQPDSPIPAPPESSSPVAEPGAAKPSDSPSPTALESSSPAALSGAIKPSDSPIPAALESSSPTAGSGVAQPDAAAFPQESEPPAAGLRETSRVTGKEAVPKEAAPSVPARRAEESESPAPGVQPAEIAPDAAVSAAGSAPPIKATAPPPPDNRPPAIREPAPAPEPPRAIETRRVEVRIAPQEDVAAPPVDVVVSQRGASLHFSVHSADGRLGAQMRQSWGELAERLEGLGYRAAPASAAELAPAVREPAGTEKPWPDANGSPGSAFSGQERRQGRRDRSQWRLTLAAAGNPSASERSAV
jgi:hypothetical protein